MTRWTAACVSLVFASLAFAQDRQPPEHTVPAGAPPTVDGVVGDKEWEPAAKFPVKNLDQIVGEAWLRRDGRMLYIAFRNKFASPALGIRFNLIDPATKNKWGIMIMPTAAPGSPIALFHQLGDKAFERVPAARCRITFGFIPAEGLVSELSVPLDLLELPRAPTQFHMTCELWDLVNNKVLASYPADHGPVRYALLDSQKDWGAGVAKSELPEPDEALAMLESLGSRENELEKNLGFRDGKRRDAPLAAMEERLRGLIKKYPSLVSLRISLVYVLQGRNMLRDALLELDTIPKAQPFVHRSIFSGRSRSEILYGLGEYDAAVDLLKGGEDLFEKKEGARLLWIMNGMLHNWELEQKIRKEEAKRDDLPRVRLQTSKGAIVLELYEDDAPNAVANFITLAESGAYDGTRFHWVSAGHAVYAGDPNSRDDDPANDGLGGPGYMIESEPGRRLRWPYTVAFADRRGEPRSEGSTFTINLTPSPEIDGTNSVFGRVVEGQNVVCRLEYYDLIEQAKVIRKRAHEYKVVKRD